MMFPYIAYLILAGFVGIHCKITTVSKVSVKAGDSISIPCLYDLDFRNNVKYLCKNKLRLFGTCAFAVKTNKPDESGKFSITDDTNQTVFTVTINDLKHEDANYYYWCAVEKQNRDVKQRFRLSVTQDIPSLYVDKQEVAAFEGGSVTVMCHYKDLKVTEWCRVNSTCVAGQTGSIQGTTVTINESVPDVFNVTMSDLRTESSGWYWCTSGDLQMPVHLTVHELTSTTTTTMNPSTAKCTGACPTTSQNSSLATSAEPQTAQPTSSTVNNADGENLQDEHKISTMVPILTTTCVLLVLVLAAFFGWRMIRHRKSKPEDPDITAGPQTASDPDVLYTTIIHNQHAAAQKKQDHTPEDSVTYSTLAVKDSAQQKAEHTDESLIYSTIQKC